MSDFRFSVQNLTAEEVSQYQLSADVLTVPVEGNGLPAALENREATARVPHVWYVSDDPKMDWAILHVEDRRDGWSRRVFVSLETCYQNDCEAAQTLTDRSLRANEYSLLHNPGVEIPLHAGIEGVLLVHSRQGSPTEVLVILSNGAGLLYRQTPQRLH